MRILVLLLSSVLAASSSMAQAIRNCPGVYEDLDPGSIVSMTPVQKDVFQRLQVVAAREAKGEAETRTVLLAAGVLEMARIAAGTRSAEWKGKAEPTAEELFQSAQARLLAKSASLSQPASGRAGSHQKQRELSTAVAVVSHANNSNVPSNILMQDGDPGLRPNPQGTGFVELFRSTVVLVTDDYDKPADDLSDLARKALCSGTRLGDKDGTAILTAAHCVCALRLADTSLAGTRKVRMGRQTRINPNGHTYHVAQADVLPGKTSCFPGTGAGSCDSLCRGDWAHGAGLTGTDAALVFTTKFEPVDASVEQEWSYWDQRSGLAGKGLYDANVARDGRHYAVGYGYDPSVQPDATGATDFGLGVRRCGQFRRRPSCTELGLGIACDDNAELLLRADVPRVSALTDACPGDSGGPAFIMQKDLAGQPQFYIAGIVSRGPTQPDLPIWRQCGRAGSLYTFASNPVIADWIRNTVKSTTGETVGFRSAP